MAIFINDSKLMALKCMLSFIFHFMLNQEPVVSLVGYYQEGFMV